MNANYCTPNLIEPLRFSPRRVFLWIFRHLNLKICPILHKLSILKQNKIVLKKHMCASLKNFGYIEGKKKGYKLNSLKIELEGDFYHRFFSIFNILLTF